MEFKFNSIEEVLQFAVQVNRAAVVAPGAVTPSGTDPAALVKHLARIAERADKIAAIKVYRAVTGKGLKDSKEAIETAPIFNRAMGRNVTTNVDGYHGCGDDDCCPESHNVDDTPF